MCCRMGIRNRGKARITVLGHKLSDWPRIEVNMTSGLLVPGAESLYPSSGKPERLFEPRMRLGTAGPA